MRDRKRSYNQIIDLEIEEWKSRVFFPNEMFRLDTKANLDSLHSKILNARDKFTIISSLTEGSVYKIGRFLVENGIKNRDISFIEGDLIEPYIDSNAKEWWQAKRSIDEWLKNSDEEIRHKWIIIPTLNVSWNKKLALYFISQISQKESYGLLFYSSAGVADSLAQILCEESYIEVLQFPEERYNDKKSRKEIEDDGY